ncbi:hypothetical protein HAHE_15370 [Haloferula helveola]|uniref:Histidine kinase domain-containing protein n=1 Tax=Haloferula helveola TaxID=490095 RepID=A0ABM7R903_9BACT|nr:hypothetical protein HAHE_15370 [Haloferula helveola]
MTPRRDRAIALSLGLIGAVWISPIAAEETIASRFSSEWKQLRSEVEAIDNELAALPPIPLDDLGDRRAFLHSFPTDDALLTREVDFTIRLQWDEPQDIDRVVLVPARKFDAGGLEANYGFPDDFDLTLRGTDGLSMEVAAHRAMSANAAHVGHPIADSLAEPFPATELTLHISRLRPIPEGAPSLPLVALSEIFCFSGARNVAPLARIEIESTKLTQHSSYWSPELLHDERTPLGIPEGVISPNEQPPSPGWISLGRDEAEEQVDIVIDLGQSRQIDGVRMFPALRPSIEDFPGFGIPQRFRIEVSETGEDDSYQAVIDRSEVGLVNVGHNPVTLRFRETDARFVRLRATELWKPFTYYPAFLALSEIQVLKDETNLAVGAAVITTEQTEPIRAHGTRFWTREGITDDHGPSGPILTHRAWLEALSHRLKLETRRLQISQRMVELESRWRSGTIGLLSIVGLLAVCAAVVLPIRYRLREKRQVRRIRERIAGDLHDDVGTNLGSIQMLTALARTKGTPEEELELIHRVAAETVTSVRDIVWLLHPTPGSRVSTIDHLRESAAILLEPLEWKLTADFRDWSLGDQDGRHLVLFFREALHNIRRHADASKVEIEVGRDGDALVLRITDDGRGIDPQTLEQPASLRALRQRAEKLGGRVDIRTLPGEGTTVSLRFVPRSQGSAPEPVPYPSKPDDAP